MAAPKGNQYALANMGGRPAKFTVEEIDELAKELVSWADDYDSIIYREWFNNKGILMCMVPDLCKKSEEFSYAVKYAKNTVGVRRERLAMQSRIESGVFRSTQAIYDQEVKDWELERKRNSEFKGTDAKLEITVRGTMGEVKQ